MGLKNALGRVDAVWWWFVHGLRRSTYKVGRLDWKPGWPFRGRSTDGHGYGRNYSYYHADRNDIEHCNSGHVYADPLCSCYRTWSEPTSSNYPCSHHFVVRIQHACCDSTQRNRLGSGYVTIPQMVKSGLGLNFLGIILTVTVTYFLVIPVFDVVIGEIPTWAQLIK